MVDHGIPERREPIPPIGARTEVMGYYPAALRRMSWGALFGGVIVAFGLQLLFTVLGLAIGFTAIDPYERETAQGLGTGAGVWWLVTGILALFAGGWAAGRMAGLPRRWDAVLHGFMVWGVSALVSLYFLGSAVGTTVGGVMTALQRGALLTMSDQMNLRLQGTPISGSAVTRPADARAIMEDAVQEVREASPSGQETANYLASASWWTFFGLLLGATASVVGGFLGTPRRVFRDIAEPPVRHTIP